MDSILFTFIWDKGALIPMKLQGILYMREAVIYLFIIYTVYTIFQLFGSV